MMEHWIEITPDEVGSGPFVIYFPLAWQQQPPRQKPLPTPPSLQPPPPLAPAARIFATRTHYGNQTVCVYRNQSTEKPIARVMTQRSLFVTFDLWVDLSCFSGWMGSSATCRTSRFNMDSVGCFWSYVYAFVLVEAPIMVKPGFNPLSWQHMAAQWWWMPSQIPLISVTATLALCLPLSLSRTCHPCACLIYKVVMAIHSNVISCHINTYISGSYYKACNGAASGLLWGSF